MNNVKYHNGSFLLSLIMAKVNKNSDTCVSLLYFLPQNHKNLQLKHGFIIKILNIENLKNRETISVSSKRKGNWAEKRGILRKN